MNNQPSIIRINKSQAYLAGFVLFFLCYAIGQAIFFLNAKKTTAVICDAETKWTRKSEDYITYACFQTANSDVIKVKAGFNAPYNLGDSISIVYEASFPHIARVNSFKTLWLVPILYYLIPLGVMLALVMGIYTGTKYMIVQRKPFKISLSSNKGA